MGGEISDSRARKNLYERRMFKKVEAEHKRRCVDCGRLITDYRCKSCWEKLRKRNGIPCNQEGDEEPCRIFL